MLVAALDINDDDPKTYKQAMRLQDADAWKEACKAEVESLVENKVFQLVNRPTHKRSVTSKWVFKKKRGFTGEVEKYKARIVARGFTQEEGVDYVDTFSPTVRFESIRLMLAEVASKDLETTQMNVVRTTSKRS